MAIYRFKFIFIIDFNYIQQLLIFNHLSTFFLNVLILNHQECYFLSNYLKISLYLTLKLSYHYLYLKRNDSEFFNLIEIQFHQNTYQSLLFL